MKRSILLLALTVLTGNASLCYAANLLVDFEDLSVPAGGFFRGDPGHDTLGVYNSPFASRGVVFNNTFEIVNYGTEQMPSIGKSWTGWGHSNTADVTTPGFNPVTFAIENESSAFDPHQLADGGGDASANYGVASGSTAGSSVISFAGYRPSSVRITNTTWAALTMRDGDGFARKFGTDNPRTAAVEGDDWFLLKIIGLDAADQPIGNVDFYLADFRNLNSVPDYMVDAWTTVDLSSLTPAAKLTFALTSSDNSAFGMNTPAYFAIDNLELMAVPEPGGIALGLIGAALVAGLMRCNRRKSQCNDPLVTKPLRN